MYMKQLLFLALILFSITSTAKPMHECIKQEQRTKIAIVDTGIMTEFINREFMCKCGHRNFVHGTDDVKDTHGHGSNLAWLITRDLNPKTHCLLIYKYYSSGSGFSNIMNGVQSFMMAVRLGAKYINYSGGGDEESPAETKVLQDALSKGIRIVVAGGNDGRDLDKKCNYFPACIKTNSPHFYAVGNCRDGKYAKSSNYGGPVNQCRDGMYKGPSSPHLLRMSGTSQSTAIFMNDLIKKEVKDAKIRSKIKCDTCYSR